MLASAQQSTNGTDVGNMTTVNPFMTFSSTADSYTTPSSENLYQQYRLLFYLGIHACVFLSIVCLTLSAFIVIKYITTIKKQRLQNCTHGDLQRDPNRSSFMTSHEATGTASSVVRVVLLNGDEGGTYLQRYGNYSRLKEDNDI